MKVRFGFFRPDGVGYLPCDPGESGVQGWFLLPPRCDRWAGPYPDVEAAIRAWRIADVS